MMRKLHLSRPSLGRSVLAGAAACTAYLAEMALDRRLTGNPYDDLIVWGALVTDRPGPRRAVGLAMHYGLGTALALVYDASLAELPLGPGWLRGTLFALTENTVLFPGLIVVQRLNRAVRRGELPPLFSPTFFVFETIRHIAYGAVLGALLNRRES